VAGGISKAPVGRASNFEFGAAGNQGFLQQSWPLASEGLLFVWADGGRRPSLQLIGGAGQMQAKYSIEAVDCESSVAFARLLTFRPSRTSVLPSCSADHSLDVSSSMECRPEMVQTLFLETAHL
jgi:hypothetical protein